jgi:hypothetical protein
VVLLSQGHLLGQGTGAQALQEVGGAPWGEARFGGVQIGDSEAGDCPVAAARVRTRR